MLKRLSVALLVILTLVACDTMPIKMGSESAKTTATGAAGGATAKNATASLERCGKTMGTLALLEDQGAPWYYTLTRKYGLTSTLPVLRLLVQQSNCFVVVERSVRGMHAMKTERVLQESGELRSGSSYGKGQMVAADYALAPTIVFSERDTGGAGALLGGQVGGVIGGLIGSLKFREANTMLSLVDNRSSVQVGAAEGSASKADLGLFGGLLSGGKAGGLGGYTKTPEGKVIVAAFTDAYNQLVRALREYRPQEAPGPGGLGTGGTLEVR